MPLYMAKDTREALGYPTPSVDNRSLLYDKFVPVGDGKEKGAAIQRLLSSRVNRDWKESRSWDRRLPDGFWAVERFSATLCAPLMVNMAGGVQENAGLCFDAHFGIPYVPGSALKGIALRAAQELCSEKEDVTFVFGEQNHKNSARKGGVSFLSAYAENLCELGEDIITCHHATYYHGDSEVALDNEAPTPVPFPMVQAGAVFSFVLVGQKQHTRFVNLARQWLIHAVTERGVGAKTSAGYGWFAYDAQAEEKRKRALEDDRRLEQKRMEDERRELERLAALDEVGRKMEELKKLDSGLFNKMPDQDLEKADEVTCRAYIRLLRTPEKKEKWKHWKKKEAAKAEKLLNMAKKLGEELS